MSKLLDRMQTNWRIMHVWTSSKSWCHDSSVGLYYKENDLSYCDEIRATWTEHWCQMVHLPGSIRFSSRQSIHSAILLWQIHYWKDADTYTFNILVDTFSQIDELTRIREHQHFKKGSSLRKENADQVPSFKHLYCQLGPILWRLLHCYLLICNFKARDE